MFSISVWHSSTNCTKLGLQPLLHPISGGAEGFLLLIISQGSGETAMVRTCQGAQVAGEEAGGWGSPPSPGNSACLSSAPRGKERRRWIGGSDGDKANYFHLWAAPCQQTCNLKRSQWSLRRLWALGEYGFTDKAVTARVWERPFYSHPTCHPLKAPWCTESCP